ncbi:MAG: chemotaxis protein CheW [Gammaproteobacteria bacterium]|nr:chemotaxis protein CheW [Gammaproteobacteria bacterium]
MQNIREVYSLLIPLENGRIVLPRAAVSEVTGFVQPKDKPEGAPDFILGFIDWQKQRIPLVSFEAACGKPIPETGRRARIAIVFSIEGRLRDPSVFALLTQGYPYLVRVNEGVLQLEEMEEGDEDAPVLTRTRMANERPKIPDLSRLENMIADALGIAEADEQEPEEASAEPVDELEALAAGEDEEEDFFDALADDDSSKGDPASKDSEDSEDEEFDLDSISFDSDDDESDDEDVDLGDLDDFLKGD